MDTTQAFKSIKNIFMSYGIFLKERQFKVKYHSCNKQGYSFSFNNETILDIGLTNTPLKWNPHLIYDEEPYYGFVPNCANSSYFIREIIRIDNEI